MCVLVVVVAYYGLYIGLWGYFPFDEKFLNFWFGVKWLIMHSYYTKLEKFWKKKNFYDEVCLFLHNRLSRIPLQCVRTIASERGWGGHFYTFAVFLSTLTSTQRYCLLECRKGLLGKTQKKILQFSSKLKFWGFGLRHPRSRISRLTTSETPPEEGRLFNLSLKRI